jgi:hypothetical protein
MTAWLSAETKASHLVGSTADLTARARHLSCQDDDDFFSPAGLAVSAKVIAKIDTTIVSMIDNYNDREGIDKVDC